MKLFFSLTIACFISICNVHASELVNSTDSIFEGKVSFVGGKGNRPLHAPIGPGYISPVDAYFIAYAIGEQLLFVNSLDYMQYVPFTIEDESGETVEASSVYIPASGSVYFDLSGLETDMLYRIVVVIDNTNYYGYFYKEE